ncbi:MAG TPA: CBASS cGAMP-activated phospholipase [Fimbriimonadaceae bacterium]
MKILTIDGGGMKGVFACSYLATLESHFGKKLDQHFDLIAGTSTGGIIALGLAAGKTAAELLSFYREHGKEIFPEGKPEPKRQPMRFFRGAFHLKARLEKGYWYESEPLQQALAGVLTKPNGKPLLMCDASTRLLIPAVNAQTAFPRVFKAHRGEPQVAHLTRDTDIPMIAVALATAAAPWYLPIAKLEEGGAPFTYIDGGLWANNPSVVAITEALTYYVGVDRAYSGIELLSVALPSSAGYSNDGKYRRGQKFIDQLLSYSMESSKHGTDQTAKFLLRGSNNVYYRVQPKNLTEEQSERLKLDSASDEAVGELMMLGGDQAQNDKNLDTVKAIFS